MNRPPKINTGFQVEQPQLSPYMGQPPAAYPVYANGGPVPGYYPPTAAAQPGGFYVYTQPALVPAGPSRRPSHQPEYGGPVPSQMYPGQQQQQQFDPSSYSHPAAPQWDTASASSTTSTHKRKRSGSSNLKEELRTPRKSSVPSLPDVSDSRSSKRPLTGGSQLPTPPSTGGNVATPSGTNPLLSDDKGAAVEPKHGVYVTTTEEEGRKLGLVQAATGAEAVEEIPARGPPRTKRATTLSINASGMATLGSTEVLQSDVALLDNKLDGPSTPVVPQTPNGKKAPQTPSADVNDTPRTKQTKTDRRLEAFNPSARPSEPMFSIKLDMGQGQPCRVALRKDLALAFVGLDKGTKVVEETRGEDQDGWTVNGEPGSRPPKRPDWPDEEPPWKIGSGGRPARQLREEKERTTLLRRYLESSSDDEDDDDGAARFPQHKGKNAIRARPRPTATGAAAACNVWDNNPSDARAALLSALNKGRRAPRGALIVPSGVVACICKQTGPTGSMISCSSCKTWHHLGCVGLDEVQIAPNWVCDPCVAQARRATLSTPARSTPSAFAYSSAARSSAFRGNQAVALAPSPMFAGEAARAAGGGPLEMRTPNSPSRSSRQRGRVLSYGGDLWGISGGAEEPSTPVPPPRNPVDHFSTPLVDDSIFDVNSTPSRHLDTDPRMGGQFSSLFAMTPLMGRSRNTNSVLIAGDTPMQPAGAGGHRIPFSDGIASRHQFLQGLTAERRGPHTERPARMGLGSGLALGGGPPVSPSPFGHRRNHSGSLSHIRSGSRSGLGLGMAVDEEDEETEVEVADDAVRFGSDE